MRYKALIATSALVWGMAGASAADIKVSGTTVYLSGNLVDGDYEKFKEATKNLDKATIILSSHGGKVYPALAIGHLIHKHGWATYVPTLCSSACAMIWTAGTPKVKYINALVGFHKPMSPDGTASRDGYLSVQSYLRGMNFNEDTIDFMTRADPHSMLYLTNTDIPRLKVDVVVANTMPAAHGISVADVTPEPVAADKYTPLREKMVIVKEKALHDLVTPHMTIAPVHKLTEEDLIKLKEQAPQFTSPQFVWPIKE